MDVYRKVPKIIVIKSCEVANPVTSLSMNPNNLQRHCHNNASHTAKLWPLQANTQSVCPTCT